MFQNTEISTFAVYRRKSSKPNSVELSVTLSGNPRRVASEPLVGVSSSWSGIKGCD